MAVPRLHIITDTVLQQRYSHLALAQMAWEAGDAAVQYRNKRFSPAKDGLEVRSMAQLARQWGKTLILNDEAVLAFEMQAQGVHLGQGDGQPIWARRLLGPKALIGATVHNQEELAALKGQRIDYIGVGPVFGTRSKDTGLPALGLDGLAALCALSEWPVIAIGSIGLKDVVELKAAGAHGVAVISAFCLAENPIAVAKAFLEKLAE